MVALTDAIPVAGDRQGPCPAAIRRSRWTIVEQAEALMRNPGRPVSLEHVCQALGVKERTLRNAFYAVRGASPKQAVRDARLRDVRRVLQRARAVKGTITHVATDYGFYDLGRFACSYKTLFGETPSETLQGASAPALQSGPAATSPSSGAVA